MNIIKTKFAGLLVIEPKVWGDNRGYFFESFNKEALFNQGVKIEWIQDNESFSEKGVLRGLHYQLEPKAQTKLVRVARGEVLDVVLDIRPDSDTFGESFSIILSGTNKKQLLVPKGFAHGYVVLSDTALFLYKVDNLYSQELEAGIKFDDPKLNIDWILPASELKLSDKDKAQPTFEEHKPFGKMKEKKKTVLVTGANGQIGQSIRKIANQFDQYDFHYYDIKELDITDGSAVKKEVESIGADVFINCAAYTNVDAAEDNEEKNWNVNVIATHNIARICKKHDILLFHYSSDYVYHSVEGEKMDELTPTTPQSKYAASKLRSEEVIDATSPRAIIMRTSWVYSEFGHNFLKTMLSLGKNGEAIKVVNDQIGAPTYATDIALTTLSIIEQIERKSVPLTIPMIINYAGEGQTNWHGFAAYIFKCANIEVNLSGIPSEEYPTKASRPKWSVLDMTLIKSTFGIAPKYWKESVKECIQILGD
jgi:dTDP-4-dehydrorhamnose reductase/dTDP-4-dehydrorhamnose 3,5-epimerase